MEFQILNYFSQKKKIKFEVLTGDHLIHFPNCFDTIFCLGVLYHTADPIAMLRLLYTSLKPGGELVIDCQGIEVDSQSHQPLCLFPKKAYAGANGIDIEYIYYPNQKMYMVLSFLSRDLVFAE